MKTASRPKFVLPPAVLALALLATAVCQAQQTSPTPPPLATPPQQVDAPQAPQTVAAGKTVAFTVTVKGTPPLRYQWRKNHVNLPGATGETFVLSNVQPANSGSYTAVVSNIAGMTVSAPMVITVVPSSP